MIERHGDTWIQIRDIDGDDERFDVLFWQAQGPDAMFHAAWELVETVTRSRDSRKMNSSFSDLLSLFNRHHVR